MMLYFTLNAIHTIYSYCIFLLGILPYTLRALFVAVFCIILRDERQRATGTNNAIIGCMDRNSS